MLSAAEGVLIFILVQFLLGGGGVKYGGKVLKHEINKWKLYSMFIQCLHIISLCTWGEYININTAIEKARVKKK